MRNNKVCILWDDSRIWGLMALRAAKALGFSPCLLKAQDIARNALHGNGCAALLVPGGRASAKAAALGEAGFAKIRSFVRSGGAYIGFCGGAGLALTPNAGVAGLGLCPWRRGEYPTRLQHLISGDIAAAVHLADGGSARVSLPVWWPGKFAPASGHDVAVLAESLAPGEDFWLADIRPAGAPESVRGAWQAHADLGLRSLAGQPLVACGRFGQGRYLLSYSHLETPQSPFANAWFGSLLGEMCGITPGASPVPAWTIPQYSPPSQNAAGGVQAMAEWAGAKMENLLRLGQDLRLFFLRASWLFGWRAGIAGMSLNSLRLGLAELAKTRPTRAADLFWRNEEKKFMPSAEKFFAEAEAALWHLRLERTLGCPGFIAGNAASIFGHPMQGGGLVGRLLETVYELIFLNASG